MLTRISQIKFILPITERGEISAILVDIFFDILTSRCYYARTSTMRLICRFNPLGRTGHGKGS